MAIAAKPPLNAKKQPGVELDLVRSYLRDIGRVPLLTNEQEITLGRQVQELMSLEALECELTEKRGKQPNLEALANASELTPVQLRKKKHQPYLKKKI